MKMKFKFTHLILLIPTLLLTVHSKSESDNEELFVPSYEWKIVKPGQKVPEGLHMRLNMQTGLTEAKLIDKSNDKSSSNSLAKVSETKEVNKEQINLNDRAKNLKKMLKNIKNELKQEKPTSKNETHKFRSYDELKKEFAKVKMAVKTDLEIIRELMAEYNSTGIKLEQKISILKDLEYYLHQLDNANNFWDMGGINLLYSAMDEGNANLQIEALKCLTSGIQGNSRLKVKSMKSGLITKLIKQLSAIRTLSDASSISLATHILSVIGATTRQFPLAQTAFVSAGGLDKFGELLLQQYNTNHDMVSKPLENLTVKILTLISDWLQERTGWGSNTEKMTEEAQTRKMQYKKLNLTLYIKQGGWCKIAQILTNQKADQLLKQKNNKQKPDQIHTESVTLDTIEKLTILLDSMRPVCREMFNLDVIGQFLNESESEIKSVNDGDSYYIDLLKLIKKVSHAFSTNSTEEKPQEL